MHGFPNNSRLSGDRTSCVLKGINVEHLSAVLTLVAVLISGLTVSAAALYISIG